MAPGEIVALSGANPGPTTGVSLQLSADGKTLLTSLGGTRVLFNGQAAPVVFTSGRQVNVVVPYAISDKPVVDVQVEYQGVLSNSVSLPVMTAAPALFSADSSGKGQGAILNQDNSLNGVMRPSSPGEGLVLFATGEGLSNPLPRDGELAPMMEPLPRSVLPVQVTIGGKAVRVLYAGGAPGFTAGLFQRPVAGRRPGW